MKCYLINALPLQVLNLSKTRISVLGIEQLAELKSLKHLDISDCAGMLDPHLDPNNSGLLAFLKAELPKCTIVLQSGKVLQDKI